MRKQIKQVGLPILRAFMAVYFKRNRYFKYNDMQILIKPTVFSPQFFISTRILLKFLESLDLRDKKTLELGCGAGTIAMLMASKGAEVTATDINSHAAYNTKENAKRLGLEVTTIESDLFTNIPQSIFDYIVINPPYYPKKPTSEKEFAWYCGEDYMFFERLFSEVEDYLSNDSKIFMILSEDCDLDRILEKAKVQGFSTKTIYQEKQFMEWNYIFSFQKQPTIP